MMHVNVKRKSWSHLKILGNQTSCNTTLSTLNIFHEPWNCHRCFLSTKPSKRHHDKCREILQLKYISKYMHDESSTMHVLRIVKSLKKPNRKMNGQKIICFKLWFNKLTFICYSQLLVHSKEVFINAYLNAFFKLQIIILSVQLWNFTP